MYRKLLVPLDGSTFSEHALTLATPIARWCGASLRLVLVRTPLPLYASDIVPVRLTQQWTDAHREREAEYLERRAERLREEGVEATSEVRDGDVADELRKLTDEVDMVVLATHGRGGFARAWLGSVADELVRHVTKPVLLIRPPSEEGAAPAPPASPPVFRRILAATDGSSAADAAVDHAAALARMCDAGLTLLRVVAFPGGLASPYIPHTAEMDREVVERGDAEAQRTLAERAEAIEGVEVRTRVVHAYHAARGILMAIEESECDLVAVGTQRRTVLGRVVLGSTADKVIRASPVPVLVGHAEH